jgi:DNA repair protein RecN (Recombination protein N)
MLTNIYIRNLATIEELHLNFSDGTTMITGETGAGKSVFIEAIELALGGRAAASMIRPGKDKTDISLCFNIHNFPAVITYLTDLDLYQDNDECIIRRILTTDGRSRYYVNGAPITLQIVKELGESLFHLHSQHDQQVLLKSDTQREMLDRYGDQLPLALTVKTHAETWKSLDQQIKALHEQTMERSQRSDYLQFQLDELKTVQLTPGEWETLESEHHKLTHAKELMQTLQSALQHITENEQQAILSLVHEVRKLLESVHTVEAKTVDWSGTLHSIAIQLGEVVSEVKSYMEHTELDPEKLFGVEERMSQIFNLARKHKIAPTELVELQARLADELHALSVSDETLTQLLAQQKMTEQLYTESAAKLSQARKKTAVKLEKEITATMRSLSLPHGEFKIALEQDQLPLAVHGQEKICFLIKTNPGQPLQPLTKVISGGELSRLSLSAHLALANRTNIPTLVFDEIDTGLSGATAEKIGKLLRKLGESYQVFCISHQAQVAACGHHHVLVEKSYPFTFIDDRRKNERNCPLARW